MKKQTQINSIKNWPQTERPRERLFRDGADSLSEAELLAILLRHGFRGKDAIALAREMLSHYGGLRGLLSQNAKGLRKMKGMGDAKTATLLAAMELSRRYLKSSMIGQCAIRDPQSVIDYLTRSLRDHKREIFKVLFLNRANRVASEKDLFEGTVDEAAVHTREVVKAALDSHASSLILVHNHPSGRIQPSQEDREITRKIERACDTVSIRILDHIIVGDNQYFSFREHNLLMSN